MWVRFLMGGMRNVWDHGYSTAMNTCDVFSSIGRSIQAARRLKVSLSRARALSLSLSLSLSLARALSLSLTHKDSRTHTHTGKGIEGAAS